MPYGNLAPTYLRDQHWKTTVLAPKEAMNWVNEAPKGTFDHFDAEGILLNYEEFEIIDGQVNIGVKYDCDLTKGRREADEMAKKILDEYDSGGRIATIRDFEVLR